jgi:hypothetical protein
VLNEQNQGSVLHDLVLQQERDSEKLKEAQEAVIHLAGLLDNLPERERRHIAPLLLLMAKRASLPKKEKDQDRKAPMKVHALLSVVARNYID